MAGKTDEIVRDVWEVWGTGVMKEEGDLKHQRDRERVCPRSCSAHVTLRKHDADDLVCQ